MIIRSDWHIHTEASYDASLPLREILETAQTMGIEKLGITDHLNFNDRAFVGNLLQSVRDVKALQPQFPQLVMGVELTPIEKPEFDYIAKTGTREGYEPPIQDKPYDLELAMTKEELMALGVRYAVGGAHWRLDVPHARQLPADLDACLREWHRQQLWLTCDERVTILAHPWYNGRALWYADFDIIPRSMKMELAAALKEKGKFVECNGDVLCDARTSERFRRQYTEFMRELFEMGIPVTYGSDSHTVYAPHRDLTEQYLRAVGFREGDFSTLTEKDLW